MSGLKFSHKSVRELVVGDYITIMVTTSYTITAYSLKITKIVDEWEPRMVTPFTPGRNAVEIVHVYNRIVFVDTDEIPDGNLMVHFTGGIRCDQNTPLESSVLKLFYIENLKGTHAYVYTSTYAMLCDMRSHINTIWTCAASNREVLISSQDAIDGHVSILNTYKKVMTDISSFDTDNVSVPDKYDKYIRSINDSLKRLSRVAFKVAYKLGRNLEW